MALKVEVNDPTHEKGVEFDLGGFLVPNGGSVELDEAQEAALVARKGKSAKEALSGNPNVKVSGSALIGGKALKDILPEAEETSKVEEGGEA